MRKPKPRPPVENGALDGVDAGILAPGPAIEGTAPEAPQAQVHVPAPSSRGAVPVGRSLEVGGVEYAVCFYVSSKAGPPEH